MRLGDEMEQLHNAIGSTLTITLDNAPVYQYRSSRSFGLSRFRYPDSPHIPDFIPRILSSCGDGIDLSIDIHQLEAGDHTASLSVQDTAGVTFIYEWGFYKRPDYR